MQRMCFFLVLFALCCVKANADSLVLDWSPSPSSSVVGYDVYYGTSSGIYLYETNVGSATQATISNLVPGVTYYFVATAYDAQGNQSLFSSEISYTVPGSALLTVAPAANLASQFGMQFSAQTGHWYEIQATTDLVNWTTIWQSSVVVSNTLMEFTDPAAALFASRFYRMAMH
jgi:hypothetical protein